MVPAPYGREKVKKMRNDGLLYKLACSFDHDVLFVTCRVNFDMGNHECMKTFIFDFNFISFVFSFCFKVTYTYGYVCKHVYGLNERLFGFGYRFGL